MNVLVTGGAGFLGSALARALVTHGHRVTTLDKLTYAGDRATLSAVEEAPNHAFGRLNVSDAAGVHEVFATARSELVFHPAAADAARDSADGRYLRSVLNRDLHGNARLRRHLAPHARPFEPVPSGASMARLARFPLGLFIALILITSGASAQISNAEFAARRAALADQLEDGVFVARGAAEPVQDYRAFFQNPGFLYLTGYREPAASLIMQKRGRDVRWTLLVQHRNPSQEVWSGERNGATRASELTGIPARSSDEFDMLLATSLKGAKRLHVLTSVAESGDTLNGDDRWLERLRRTYPAVEIIGANARVERLRATKSAAELEVIRKATAISMDAHREAMKAVEPGMNEFEIQALVEYTFRRYGAERPAYASIVGSGPNGTTLHYNRNDRFMSAGDVIVMDVGAQFGGYASDLTRSFPVSGTFSPDQRAIYQIVRDAQAAAERNAQPGRPAKLMSDSAQAVIAEGLARVGLIESPNATYDCGDDRSPRQCPQVTLYYMHGLGHGVGLEVHDPEQFYFTGVIGKGSAFTIEPGIYVRPNLLDIIPKTSRNAALATKIGEAVGRHAGIGVRIEDVYLVTDQGLEWVSCGLPREVDEVEALMRERYAGPAARDATKVEWNRVRDGSTTSAPGYQRPSACVKL